MSRVANTPSVIIARLVPVENGCHLWPGSKYRDGYGRVRLNCKMVRVHKLVYEHLRGPVPEGRELHHMCGNKACANVEHLEVLTRREHVMKDRKMIIDRANQTHCLRGHEFTEANTYRQKNGGRSCRACGSLAKRLERSDGIDEAIGPTGGSKTVPPHFRTEEERAHLLRGSR